MPGRWWWWPPTWRISSSWPARPRILKLFSLPFSAMLMLTISKAGACEGQFVTTTHMCGNTFYTIRTSKLTCQTSTGSRRSTPPAGSTSRVLFWPVQTNPPTSLHLTAPPPLITQIAFHKTKFIYRSSKLQLIVHDKSLNQTRNTIIKENHMRSPCLNLTTRFAAWGNGWPDEGRSIRGLFTERGGRFMSSLFFCLIISCWGSQLDRATSA